MDDPIELWNDIICRLNDEKKCGWCWRFFAPLTEVNMNLVKQRKECCVNVFFIWNGAEDFATRPNFDLNTGLMVEPTETFNYQVYFLINSNDGINNYNEMPEHPVSESKYLNIFKPLRECINLDILNALCLDYVVTNWSGKNIYDTTDDKYYGIRINVTTTKRI